MAQKSSVTYFTFKGGLNTEASPLNCPAEDATAIENIQINRDGSIQPRRSFDLVGKVDANSDLFAECTTDYSSYGQSFVQDGCGTYLHTVIGSDQKFKQFIILHIDRSIKIYEYTSSTSLKDIANPYQVISLTDYSDNQVREKSVFTSYKNKLFIFNMYLPWLYLDYDQDTGVFAISELKGFVRDIYNDDAIIDAVVKHTVGGISKRFVCIQSHDALETTEPGVGTFWKDYWRFDGAASGSEAAWALNPSPSDGYVVYRRSVYKCIQSHTNRGPSKEPNYWEFVRRLADFEKANIAAWDSTVFYTPPGTVDYTSSIVPLDVTAKSITYVDEVNPDITVTTRGTIGYTFGRFIGNRLWMLRQSEPTTVYYSQMNSEKEVYNLFYQEADPKSATDSDVVETDGGFIRIPAAEKILNIVDYENGVIVIATKGIWYITGADYFTPTAFTIQRVSEEGGISRDAVAIVKTGVIYCGKSGIYLLSAKDQFSNFPKQQSISAKIDSFYKSISNENMRRSKLVYDEIDSKLYWFGNLSNLNWTITEDTATRCRDILVLDFVSQGWSIYKLNEDLYGTELAISDVFIAEGSKPNDVYVVDDTNSVVVDNNDTYIVVDEPYAGITQQVLYFLFTKRNGTTGLKYAFGYYGGSSTVDFTESDDNDEYEYDASIEFSHQLFGDAIHHKQAPYIMTIFERVESGILNGNGEDITAGSCLMGTSWDWAKNSTANVWGSLREVYNPIRFVTSQYNGEANGYQLVVQRHKVRGRGYAIKFRFEKNGTKDFKLYGWQIIIDPKTTV